VSDPDLVTSLRAAERQLQAAQLASDVAVLDEMLDDGLLFTGPDGSLLSKEDDLNAHRSGRQKLRQLDQLDLRVRVVGSTGMTWVLMALAGSVGSDSFEARVRYTRTWTHDAETGWKTWAAQATFASAS
jgi:ketosteroid isomerase-like protein